MKKPGRPKSEHSIRHQVRCHAEQLAAWRAAAEAEGRTLQGWIRWHLDQAAHLP